MGGGRARVQQNLREQLSFLRNYCDRWDNGEWQYAKPIANSVRLLFHDKGRTVSIVTQFGARSTIRLLDFVPWGNDEHTVLFLDPLLFLGTGANLVPGPITAPRLVSVDEWWHEIVCALSAGRFTREDIVLTVAEKDGGTHLDGRLPPDYKKLAAPGASGFYKNVPTRDAPLIQRSSYGESRPKSSGARALKSSRPETDDYPNVGRGRRMTKPKNGRRRRRRRRGSGRPPGSENKPKV